MTTILHIESSVRDRNNVNNHHNSLSKSLARTFVEQWQTSRKEDPIIYRDLGQIPPDFITQDWVSAAFSEEEFRSEEQKNLLALSDTLIGELAQSDIILMSSPMYNYGMPASLKAWFDQVIRINKTFSFDLARGDFPLDPILFGKKMVFISSAGEFGFEIGGIRESMNHLGPHVKLLSKYLGVDQFYEIRSEYQEFGDERHAKSIINAKSSLRDLADRLSLEIPEKVQN